MTIASPSSAGALPADFEALLPTPDAPDIEQRLANLSKYLRSLPLSPESNHYFQKAAAALLDVPDTFGSADLVMCLLFVARHGVYSGRTLEAIEYGTKAANLVDRVETTPTIRAKAWKVLGAAFMESGSYHDAIAAFSAAREAASAANDLHEQANILENIGLTHQFAGNFAAAATTFERALELAKEHALVLAQRDPSTAERDNSAMILGSLYANLALNGLRLRDYTNGLAAAGNAVKAVHSSTDPLAGYVRTMSECYFSRLLLEVRDIPAARQHAKAANEAASSGSELARLHAEMVQGLVDVYDPATRDIGLSRLQANLTKSRKVSTSILSDALAMLVRAYEVTGQLDLAEKYLNELSRTLRDRNEIAALQHHQRHMQQLERDFASEITPEGLVELEGRLVRGKIASRQYRELSIQKLERLAVTAELRDDPSGAHAYRVARLASLLAQDLGCDEEFVFNMDLAGRLHDIGKISIPDHVMLKPSRLTDTEFNLMKTHTTVGANLLARSKLPQIQIAEEIARSHHERWDGAGYPAGLAGDQIPLAARIFAVADLFEAMTHTRPYKAAWPVADSLREVARMAGTQFDPAIAPVFVALVERLQRDHPDLDAFLGQAAAKSAFVQPARDVFAALRNPSDDPSWDARR